MYSSKICANAAKLCVLTATSILVCLPGCGQAPFPVKPARGKVLCDGKPVASGSILFTPIAVAGKPEPGKPASATVGSDGSFVLSTFGRFDGAIVGKHRVVYSQLGEDESDEEPESLDDDSTAKKRPKQKPSQSSCKQEGEIFVEVLAAGPNDFTIELTP